MRAHPCDVLRARSRRQATKRTRSSSQSRVGAEHAGGRRRRGGCAGRSRPAGPAAASAKRARGAWRWRSGPRGPCPVSGSIEVEHADVGQLELAGVDDLDGRAPRGGRRARAAAGPTPPGARKSETTTTRPRRRVAAARRRSGAGEVGGARVVVLGRRAAARCSSAWRWARPVRAGTRRRPARPRARPRRCGCRCAAVRKPTAAMAASARSRFSQSAVPKSRLAERSASTHVSSSRSAIVWRMWGSTRAGGDVPVDAADVVAGLVRPGLARLGAVAGHEPAVVALQQAVEAAGDGQLEAAQHLRRRAGGDARRAVGLRGRGAVRRWPTRRFGRLMTSGAAKGEPGACDAAAPEPGGGRGGRHRRVGGERAATAAGSCDGRHPGRGHGAQQAGQEVVDGQALGQRLVAAAPAGGAARRGRRRRRPGAGRRCGPAAGRGPGPPATRPRLARGLAPKAEQLVELGQAVSGPGRGWPARG